MPHSFGDLFARLGSFEHLYDSYLAARRGKRDRPEVREFDCQLEHNLLGLQSELVSGRWQPGRCHNFYVHEHKKRLITAAPFRDRVVHHALVRVLEPCFEPTFISDSYACRAGKGQHRAIDRFQGWLRGSRYVLRADIRKFYPSVDHELLSGLIARRIRDPRVLDLVRVILRSGEGILDSECEPVWFPGDDRFTPGARRRGLPIGNLTSQFLGNVYLNELDHFVKEALCRSRYLRYMDDFVVLSDRRSELRDGRARIADFLSRLRLVLNPAETRVWRTTDGVEFLGFRVFPHYRLVRKATALGYARKLGRLARSVDRSAIRDSLQAWFSHTRHAASHRLNRLILDHAGLLADGA